MSSVSAIIPVYNGEETIAAAVDSALDRAGECELEVVVVDDGSTDSTLAILESYGDRIGVLRQNHLGVSAARNHAVRESRGEYLAFLDADDLWLPGRSSKQKSVLDSDPAVGLVYSDFRTVNIETGEPLGEVRSEKAPTLEEMFACQFSLGTPTVTMRREIFAICGGFDERLSYGEDFVLWLCARQHSDFMHVPEILTVVRQPSGFLPDRRKKPPSTRAAFERVTRERFGRRANRAIRMVYDEWADMLLGTALHEIDERRFGPAVHALIELLGYRPSYLLRTLPRKAISLRSMKRLAILAGSVVRADPK
jgi:glycosyltransferase involved in cell wall biosynthesis